MRYSVCKFIVNVIGSVTAVRLFLLVLQTAYRTNHFKGHMLIYTYWDYNNYCLCNNGKSVENNMMLGCWQGLGKQLSTSSVPLRTVPELLTRAWLMATYCPCLWSISVCTVASYNTGHMQATAARPHGCNNWARLCSVVRSNTVSERVSRFAEWQAKLRGNTWCSVTVIIRS